MTYGKNVTISRASAYQRNRNVVSMTATKSGLGPVSNIITIVLIVCLLGLLYLTQVTKTNALGYQLSDLNTKKSELKEEYSSLEVESVRLQSLERIKNSNVAKSMQDTKPTAMVNN